jgi:hypothetical protein
MKEGKMKTAKWNITNNGLDGDDNRTWIVSDPQGKYDSELLICEFLPNAIKSKEERANARLIASAPDLYEIGKRIYTAMTTGKITNEIIDELNNILNKAEGRI